MAVRILKINQRRVGNVAVFAELFQFNNPSGVAAEFKIDVAAILRRARRDIRIILSSHHATIQKDAVLPLKYCA